MKPFNLTLDANETRSVTLAGNYFELRKAAAVLDLVELLNGNNVVVGTLDEVESTDYMRTKVPFGQVRITNSATAQTIRFYYGDGDSGSNRFTGVVSGEVALAAGTLAALESLDLNPATIAALILPPVNTGSFESIVTPTALTPITVFTPAANVNGAIVLSADLVSHANMAGSRFEAFVHKLTAPATPWGGAVVLSNGFTASTGVDSNYRAALSHAVRIPAGHGLYYICNSDAPTNSMKTCRYHLL